MFKTILAQEKLSEIKNDFISNMTHEFKTPISTISLACEALNDKDMIPEETSAIKPFVKMIHDENQRLSLLVERILQSAVMDRGNLKFREESVVLNEVIHDVTSHAQFRIHNSGGQIKLHLPDELISIQTDKMHLTNIITNLVDNAIKFSKDIPEIDIYLKHELNKIILTVIDKGIGIKKEHLSKIFDKLYRVPTGNLHNVKGFGLGLSYVKAIAKVYDWNVTVKSKFGEGSEFSIVFEEQDN
jgi:two-component system phosphate regulon sensor histidine kinase PhoR